MIPVMYFLSTNLLPKSFTFENDPVEYNNMGPFYAALAGCLSGMIIGLATEYYTSSTYTPVSDLIDNCLSEGGNAATNIVFGLSLG